MQNKNYIGYIFLKLSKVTVTEWRGGRSLWQFVGNVQKMIAIYTLRAGRIYGILMIDN